MLNKVALVSGSDSNYYPLLREWVESIKRFPQSAEVDLCVIDAGLNDFQRKELLDLSVKFVKPDWPCKLPERRIKDKEYLKSCVCRPMIPDLFPGYEAYVWMDSDTWVQNWKGLQYFIDGALQKPDSLIITNECNRHREDKIRMNWLWRWPIKVKSFYYGNSMPSFGFRIAKELLKKHVMSAGCFAMNAKAPHWKRWKELITVAMTKGKIFTAEQTTLGVLVYIENYKAEFLPEYSHWHCDVKFAWDEETKQFVEPFIPNEPIGVVHVSGVDDMRNDRNVKHVFKTKQGGTIELNVRYPHYNGGDLKTAKRA